MASFFAGMLIACSAIGSQYVAKVAGQPISVDDFKSALRFELEKYDTSTTLPAEQFSTIKNTLLEEMIRDRLLESEAKRLNISATEEELNDHFLRNKSNYSEAAFRKMLELKKIDYSKWQEDKKRELIAEKVIDKEVVAKIDISDKDVERYYKAHKKEFTHGDEVHARQIVTEDQKTAEEVWKKAKAGDNFAGLAQQYSISPEAKRGGDLGWFERGVMPKIFDEACFPLPTNEISPIVKTEFGYHIFKVVERRNAASKALSDVKDVIINKLRQERIVEAYTNWYEPLRKKTKIEINRPVVESLQQEVTPVDEDVTTEKKQ